MKFLKFLEFILLLTVLLISNLGFCATVDEIKKQIEIVEQDYSLPKNLLLAIVQQESDFNVKARLKNSYGLGQVTTQTARSHCGIRKVKDLYDYETNLDCAARVLKYQLERYHNSTYYAIAAYNSGTPFICTGSKFKRKLGSHLVQYLGPCKKSGMVHNIAYVSGVQKKWHIFNNT